jgi:predicted DNA-binding ArsR family transcriptional regulator
MSLSCFNLYANSYVVEIQDASENIEKIDVKNESNLIDVINDATNNQILIKSITPNSHILNPVDMRGGEGGVDG